MMVEIVDFLKYLDSIKEEYDFKGNSNVRINWFSSLNNYIGGNMTWIKSEKNIPSNIDNITLAICQKGVNYLGENIIFAEHSKKVFFSLIEHFFEDNHELPEVGEFTYISPKAKLGKNVKIGHNCTLDGNICVGDNTVIYNNVVMINGVKIGSSCIIQSGVNLGHDGFAYTEDEEHNKTMVSHHGGITIGNNVYIGGNTIVERGTLDDTIIEDGCKIDVGCIIGHNSHLNRNVALVCGSTLLGSVTMKENSYAASALIKNQTLIGKDALIGMGSVVTKDVEDKQVVVGVPAKPLRK